ncbi:MAG: adenylate kinase [bacterium]|nr:adenylate kinase [bacterium]
MSEIIIFLGMPGCGKGTHAARLATDFGYKHLSTGDLLRAEVDNATPLGKKVDAIISAGNFVSDDLISEVVLKNIQENQNYILDGFPRNLNQAKILAPFLKEKAGKKLLGVVYLELSREVVIQRLMVRGRKDDNLETIKTRLEIYFKETLPLIDFYCKNSTVYRVNTNDDIDVVYKKILKTVKLK